MQTGIFIASLAWLKILANALVPTIFLSMRATARTELEAYSADMNHMIGSTSYMETVSKNAFHTKHGVSHTLAKPLWTNLCHLISIRRLF